MTSRPIKYWALCANPDYYRIEDAVHELEFDNWVTRGSAMQAGDKALIWKYKGTRRTSNRGVIAFAEIVSDPGPAPDMHGDYQLPPRTTGQHEKLESMVTIRYILAPNLPLWIDGPYGELVNRLSVVDSQGGSVFHVTPEQWNDIVNAAGGWSTNTQAIDRRTIHRSGQGFVADVRVRQATELYAMQRATEYFKQAGWMVEDVSNRESYDLRCTHPERQELHVEVKGTTSDGTSVLLTKNEVDHARNQHPNVTLFILASIHIDYDPQNNVQASEGTSIVIEPWKIDDGALTPLVFSYRLP